MKLFIYILISAAMLIGCQESSSVEPISDYSDQINKVEEDLFGEPILDGYSEAQNVAGKYDFNPEENCGAMLYGTCLEYRYDDAITNGKLLRFIDNAQFWVPSKMVIDGKNMETYNIYTLNRVEKIGIYQQSKILGGESWGTFQVILATGHHPLDPHESPTVLFEGKFSGKVNGHITKIKLLGKGKNFLANRDFIATEVQTCNSNNKKLSCFSSELSGIIGPKLKVEE